MKLSNKYSLSYFPQRGKDEKLNYSFHCGGRQGMGFLIIKQSPKLL
jgi:hypothetical protein